MKLTLIKNLLRIGVSLLIIYFLLTQIPFSQIISIITSSQPSFIILSILLCTLIMIISTLRWQILLSYMGYRYHFNLLLKLIFITNFFNIYLPGGVVGDVVRTGILPKERNSKDNNKINISSVTASVITDRIIGLLGLMFLAFIGFVLYYKLLLDSKLLLVFGIISLGILFLFLILFSKRVQSLTKRIFALPLRVFLPVKTKIQDVTNSLLIYRERYSVFAIAIPLTILSHLCMISSFYLLAQSIDVNISFLKLVAFVPIIDIISAIPISMGGVGIREATTILLFSTEGIQATQAMSISLLYFAILAFLGAIGGCVYIIHRIKINKMEVK